MHIKLCNVSWKLLPGCLLLRGHACLFCFLIDRLSDLSSAFYLHLNLCCQVLQAVMATFHNIWRQLQMCWRRTVSEVGSSWVSHPVGTQWFCYARCLISYPNNRIVFRERASWLNILPVRCLNWILKRNCKSLYVSVTPNALFQSRCGLRRTKTALFGISKSSFYMHIRWCKYTFPALLATPKPSAVRHR